jgi:hypothetical protein
MCRQVAYEAQRCPTVPASLVLPQVELPDAKGASHGAEIVAGARDLGQSTSCCRTLGEGVHSRRGRLIRLDPDGWGTPLVQHLISDCGWSGT